MDDRKKQVERIVTPTNQIRMQKKGACNEASSSEEEDVGIRKSRRKSDFENTSEESNGKSIEEEDIKSPKCGRKGNVENVNEEKKESNSEEE